MARIGRIASHAALVALVLVAAGWKAEGVADQPPPLDLRVDGIARQAVAGSTLADAIRDLGLKPRPGDLVDVAGVTIASGRYPGHVAVNGATATATEPLRSGDRLRLVPGPDRTEPVTTTRVPVPGGEPADPEYTLGRVPGDEVTVRGRISGKVASSAFRATGPPDVPQAVALTFDDGPWPGQTRQVLAILRRLRARATFFTVGDLAAHYPGLIAAEREQRGIMVEDHSWSHPLSPPFGEQRPGVVRAQIEQARSTLISEGVTPTLFRPPGGGWSDRVVAIASSLGCRVVLWSVDPRDWAPGRTAKGIARSVLSQVEPGSIVIMHDGGGDRTATIRALPRIIRGIRRMGLRLVTVER
jgi:peptidoglycan/xylan/chitin deacetylase (PgdA/CDA1 family)/sulfur carrier protein ThiS